MLSDKDKKGYIEYPARCPYCGNYALDGDGYDREDDHVTQDMTCRACGKQWTDIYSVSDIREKEDSK